MVRECGGLGDCRMAHQRVIDFERRNLFTPTIDDVILAAVKREESLLVKAADVARFKPSIQKAGRLASGALR